MNAPEYSAEYSAEYSEVPDGTGSTHNALDLDVEAPPLPLTVRNLLIGGGYTLLIFPVALGIALFFVVLFAGFDSQLSLPYALLSGVIALVTAALVSVIIIPVAGIPLAAGFAWLARKSSTIWHHLLGQFAAGFVLAGTALVIFVAVQGWRITTGTEFIGGAAIAVLAGLITAFSWWLTLRQYRKVRPELPIGAATYDDWG